MITVLVAESSLKQRTFITNAIKSSLETDCIVLDAKNRNELFLKLEQDPVDVLLFKTEMPGLQWDHLTEHLHQCNQIPVILPMAELHSFLPSSVRNDDSVYDYLLSPFTEDELLMTLEGALYQQRLQHRAANSGSTPLRAEEDSRLNITRKKIEQYIREHYCEIISMQDVAKAMNYSDTHFCRLFKQCFQVNFSVYMNEFRVAKARDLLENTNRTVKEVGVICGYRDTSYFIRMFRRFSGMTPSDYRIKKLSSTAK